MASNRRGQRAHVVLDAAAVILLLLLLLQAAEVLADTDSTDTSVSRWASGTLPQPHATAMVTTPGSGQLLPLRAAAGAEAAQTAAPGTVPACSSCSRVKLVPGTVALSDAWGRTR